MIEKHLSSLQTLVDSLIGSHDQLALENNELRKKLAVMQQKNTELLGKKEELFKRLRDLLTQIREGALCL